MGYTRRMKRSDLEALKPIIEAIGKLGENEGLSITNTPIALDKTRSLLYNYFANYGQKGFFRIERHSDTVLAIVRVETFVPTPDLMGQLASFTVPRTARSRRRGAKMIRAPLETLELPRELPSGPGIDFLNSHLSSATDFEEVRIAAEGSGLSSAEKHACIQEWIRRQGSSYKPSFLERKENHEEGGQSE